MFEITYSNQAVKFLKNCDKNLVERIIEKIEKLRDNPFLPETIKIKGDDTLRIRVGKFRILYLIKRNDNVILITKIDKRERAYD